MSDEKRSVKRKEGEEWVTTQFEDLRKGDVFRLWEPDGTPVANNSGEEELLATSDAYLGPHGPDKSTVWTIECEDSNRE